MNSVRSLKSLSAGLLAAVLIIGIVAVPPAKLAPLTFKEQYDKATNVVVVKFHKNHPVKITKFIEYTLWEFDVLQEFKGSVYGIGSREKQNRIIVIGQTIHDWECPAPPAFKKGKEYVLFLQATHSKYLYSLVTDWQGDFETTEKLLEEIRSLIK